MLVATICCIDVLINRYIFVICTVLLGRVVSNSFRVLTFGSFNEKILKVNPVNYFMYYIIMGSPEISDEMIS